MKLAENYKMWRRHNILGESFTKIAKDFNLSRQNVSARLKTFEKHRKEYIFLQDLKDERARLKEECEEAKNELNIILEIIANSKL